MGVFKGSRPTSTSIAEAQTQKAQTQYSPQWELAKLQDELYHLLGSEDAPEMFTPERRISPAQLQKGLETWAQRHKIPSPSRPTSVDDISLHLTFLGTRMRMMLGDHFKNTSAHSSSKEVLNDARLSCLLLATSCNHLEYGALADRLDQLLVKTANSPSRRAGTRSSSNSPLQTPASSPHSSASGTLLQTNSPYLPLSTPSLDQTSTLALPPIHRLANVFPIAAIFVLARHILGMRLSAQSSQPALAQQDAEYQQEINEDILLLQVLLSRFRTALPTVKASSRGKMDDVFHRSKLGRITNHLVEIINAVKGPTGYDDTNKTNGDIDHHSLYAPQPLMTSESSLLNFDTSSNASSMPDLNYYDGSGGDISPPQLDLPLTPFSSQSTWPNVTQDLMPFSATPLLTTPNSSSYAPSLIPTPETPFDLSQFLHRTCSDSPIMWDSGQGQAELQQQQQQQPNRSQQYVPETPGKRKSRKRPRMEGSRD